MRSFSWKPGMWVLSNGCSINHYTSWIGHISQIPDFLCGPRILLPISKMAGSAPFSVLHPLALTPTLVHHENPRIQQFKCLVLPQPCLATSFFIFTDHQSCISLGKWPKFQVVLALPVNALVILFKWVILKSQSWNTTENVPHSATRHFLCIPISAMFKGIQSHFLNTSLSSLQLL